jgi:hypothetical protein
MKSTTELVAAPTPKQMGSLLVPALFFLLGCSTLAFAQTTALEPLQSDQQSPLQGNQQSSQLFSSAKTSNSVPTFLQWGSVAAHPRATYRFVSSTGLQARRGEAANTDIQTLAPGIMLELGAQWTLDYQSSWNYYSSRAFTDSIDHSVILNGATSYDDWTLSFTQNFNRSTQTLIETGGQTKVDQYGTAFNALARFGSHLALESAATQNLIYTTDFNDSKDWALVEWLHFQYSPRLDTALGAGPGYVEINKGPDTTYSRFLGKIDWRPGTKLNVHLDAGLDHRKLRSANAQATNNPIANATVGYKIFEHTALAFGASRTISVPYSPNQALVKNLGWNVSLDQRLLGRLNLTLSAGYEKSNYELSTTTMTGARDDSNHWYDARLSAAVLQRGSVSVFYHTSKNASTVQGYGFSSNQTGLEFSYRY